ncbi:Flagellar protein FliS [Halalkalibacter krulwichiae]|uniref:Flagellar protein FliS n=2 Tax=Halalkalibacter krulwichiae TaxID=199441 RepID=A0A1X9M7M1_9BACI|nr:Flagellar protein FliS [Halalkalibacter krulwichiae]
MFLSNEVLHMKTSQELTSLLYEACVTNLEEAITLILKKDYIGVNQKLQKANDIIHRLGAGINYEAGIIADQLEQVYNYIADRLVEANVKKDKKIIEEVIQLLSMIMSSWNQAMKSKRDVQSKVIKKKTSAYEKYSMYEG